MRVFSASVTSRPSKNKAATREPQNNLRLFCGTRCWSCIGLILNMKAATVANMNARRKLQNLYGVAACWGTMAGRGDNARKRIQVLKLLHTLAAIWPANNADTHKQAGNLAVTKVSFKKKEGKVARCSVEP